METDRIRKVTARRESMDAEISVVTSGSCSNSDGNGSQQQDDDDRKIILEIGSSSANSFYANQRAPIRWPQLDVAPPAYNPVYPELKEHKIVRVPNLSWKERALQMERGRITRPCKNICFVIVLNIFCKVCAVEKLIVGKSAPSLQKSILRSHSFYGEFSI